MRLKSLSASLQSEHPRKERTRLFILEHPVLLVVEVDARFRLHHVDVGLNTRSFSWLACIAVVFILLVLLRED